MNKRLSSTFNFNLLMLRTPRRSRTLSCGIIAVCELWVWTKLINKDAQIYSILNEELPPMLTPTTGKRMMWMKKSERTGSASLMYWPNKERLQYVPLFFLTFLVLRSGSFPPAVLKSEWKFVCKSPSFFFHWVYRREIRSIIDLSIWKRAKMPSTIGSERAQLIKVRPARLGYRRKVDLCVTNSRESID